MPVYEYCCLDCEKPFTALRSVDDRDKPVECPFCGSRGCQRKYSAVQFIVEGSDPVKEVGKK